MSRGFVFPGYAPKKMSSMHINDIAQVFTQSLAWTLRKCNNNNNKNAQRIIQSCSFHTKSAANFCHFLRKVSYSRPEWKGDTIMEYKSMGADGIDYLRTVSISELKDFLFISHKIWLSHQSTRKLDFCSISCSPSGECGECIVVFVVDNEVHF